MKAKSCITSLRMKNEGTYMIEKLQFKLEDKKRFTEQRYVVIYCK